MEKYQKVKSEKYERMTMKQQVKNKQTKRKQTCSVCFVKVIQLHESKFKIVHKNFSKIILIAMNKVSWKTTGHNDHYMINMGNKGRKLAVTYCWPALICSTGCAFEEGKISATIILWKSHCVYCWIRAGGTCMRVGELSETEKKQNRKDERRIKDLKKGASWVKGWVS